MTILLHMETNGYVPSSSLDLFTEAQDQIRLLFLFVQFCIKSPRIPPHGVNYKKRFRDTESNGPISEPVMYQQSCKTISSSCYDKSYEVVIS